MSSSLNGIWNERAKWRTPTRKMLPSPGKWFNFALWTIFFPAGAKHVSRKTSESWAVYGHLTFIKPTDRTPNMNRAPENEVASCCAVCLSVSVLSVNVDRPLAVVEQTENQINVKAGHESIHADGRLDSPNMQACKLLFQKRFRRDANILSWHSMDDNKTTMALVASRRTVPSEFSVGKLCCVTPNDI